jgi:hypothetical protein
MTKLNFDVNLSVAFKTHMFMKNRNYHTINELLYILEHDNGFDGEDFSISIEKLDGAWMCIPCLDAFVDIYCRSIWFNDADIEFEIEEFGEEKYNYITIRECKRNEDNM